MITARSRKSWWSKTGGWAFAPAMGSLAHNANPGKGIIRRW